MSKAKGRPTKYKAEYAEQAEKLCRLGATDVQMADFFGVTEKTLNNWKKDHPSFLQSLKAKSFSDDLVEQSLYQRAVGQYVEETREEESESGYKKTTTKKHVADTTAMIFWLKNRRPEEWREKPEGETQDVKPITIEIVNPNVEN